MGTVPTTRTWVPAELVTAAKMNSNVTAVLDWFLSNLPLFEAVQTVGQTIPTGTWTALTFTSEILDRDGGHSTSVNTSRYVGKTPGWYRVRGLGAILVNAGRFHIRIAKNGTQVPSGAGGQLGNGLGVSAILTEALVFLNGTTDYVELQVVSDQVNPNTAVLTDFVSSFNVEWKSN